jgi:excisionase family DNA binding protein
MLVTDDRLLTLAEAAEILRISLRTLRRWRTAALIHAVRIGGVVRIRLSEVERLLAEPRTSTPAAPKDPEKPEC